MDNDGRPPFDLSVVACAYNESLNLPHFLRGVLSQTGPSFRLRELVYVASGCTDSTNGDLSGWASTDPRLRPVIEEHRRGKASALARGLQEAGGDLLLLTNADTVPLPGAFEELVRPFRDPAMALTCARLVPVNRTAGFTARLADLLWEVHDAVSETLPKSTGAVVFRAGPIDLPVDIEDDDTYLGMRIGRERGRSLYARDALFLHRIPETPGDFLRQRYRINRQILGLRRRTGMLTSTWRPSLMAGVLRNVARREPGKIPLMALLAVTEGAVRVAALASRLLPTPPLTTWDPLVTTKLAIDPTAARD